MSEPPGMFSQPTDPADPLPPLRVGGSIVEMHAEWARVHGTSGGDTTMARRLRDKAISLRARLGGTDRHFSYMVRAVDEVAARCDELALRVRDIAIGLDDIARTLGEDVTRLRAEVESATRGDPEGPRSSLP